MIFDARAVTNAVVNLGSLALDFGRVDRITYHPDGETPESDTDHTVMLGLIACAVASRHFPHLDVGLVAQYALVHDLVEVYAGDTPTLRIPSPEDRAAKRRRERQAYERIETEFVTTLPWVPNLIDSYERRETPEARFIKVLDKFLPKVNHLLNNAETIRQQGMSVEQLRERLTVQRTELVRYADDFADLFRIWDVLVEDVLAQLADSTQGREQAPQAGGEVPMTVSWDDLKPGAIIRYQHVSRARRLAGKPLVIRRGRVDKVYSPVPGVRQGQITLTPLNKDGSPNASLRNRTNLYDLAFVVSVDQAAPATGAQPAGGGGQ